LIEKRGVGGLPHKESCPGPPDTGVVVSLHFPPISFF
jgi:hypothetical protein